MKKLSVSTIIETVVIRTIVQADIGGYHWLAIFPASKLRNTERLKKSHLLSAKQADLPLTSPSTFKDLLVAVGPFQKPWIGNGLKNFPWSKKIKTCHRL